MLTISPTVAETRARLETVYGLFFRDLGIDWRTGDLPESFPGDRKFATYPYIGSNYGRTGSRKCLVVGLDIGSDETPGEIQGFERRRRAIECKPVEELNPHIAGTYFSALRYACPQHGWDRFKGAEESCQRLLKGADPDLPDTSPLSYIALTNFYKWVTKGREEKGGARDRVNSRRDLTEKLFLDEVRVFEPDVVVFQSTRFAGSDFEDLRRRVTAELHVLPHPSYRGRRRPRDITRPRLSRGDESTGTYDEADEAAFRGLLALGGLERPVQLADLMQHTHTNGFRAPRGGYGGHLVARACRELARTGSTYEDMRIVKPRWGCFQLERAD